MDILVVEDDSDAAELYRAALESRGHGVDLTVDGSACLKAYRNRMKELDASGKRSFEDLPYDAVIIDYKIPNVDGLQVAREILSLNPHQRIIFASAYTKSTLADAVTDLKQVVELIQKPFEPELIVDIVEDRSVIKKLGELNTVDKNMRGDGSEPIENEINSLLARLKKIQKEGTLS